MKIFERITLKQSLHIFFMLPVFSSFLFSFASEQLGFGERNDYALIVLALNIVSVLILALKIKDILARGAFVILYFLLCSIFFFSLSEFSPLSYLGFYLYCGFIQGDWSLDIFNQIYLTFTS